MPPAIWPSARSFSRAARKLRRTQPAVSQAVRRLEQASGERLIDRSARDGTLTEEQAIAELERCAGTQFDPEIIEVFVRLNQPSAAAKSKGSVAKAPPEL